MNSSAVDPLTLGLLLVLTIAMPVIGIWDYRRFLRKLREGRQNARLEAYLWTIALQWIVTIGFMGWWLVSGRGFASVSYTHLTLPTASSASTSPIAAVLPIPVHPWYA